MKLVTRWNWLATGLLFFAATCGGGGGSASTGDAGTDRPNDGRSDSGAAGKGGSAGGGGGFAGGGGIAGAGGGFAGAGGGIAGAGGGFAGAGGWAGGFAGAGGSGGGGGAGGGGAISGDAGVGTRDAGQNVPGCHEEGGACNTATDFCCNGFTCGNTTLKPSFHCMKNCAGHGECSTGCCAPLGTSGINVCLPQSFCPTLFCRTEEQTCVGENPCCAGLTCAVFGTVPQTSACKKICTDHKNCATGCCAPLGGSGVSVCLDKSFCPEVFCRAEEQTCAGENACCDGLTCVVFPTNPPTSACKKVCTQHNDCTVTGCCVPLGPGYPSACLDKLYCPTTP